METDWKEEPDYLGNKQRTQVSAELVDEGCVRVVLRATGETFDTKSNRWSPPRPARSAVAYVVVVPKTPRPFYRDSCNTRRRRDGVGFTNAHASG